MQEALITLLQSTGFSAVTWRELVMIGVSLLLMYLAIWRKFEPLLLLPISFGILIGNLPLTGFMDAPSGGVVGGLLYYLYKGVELGIYPPLVFMGIGAMTDFGPLIANPSTILLGGAAQLGIFIAFMGALLFGYSPQQSAAIGIIGGANGPASILVATRLAPELLGPIAIAAYSYMALVPIIQPPLMRALTRKADRRIVMAQLRPVSKTERILFAVIVTILVALMLPSAATLVSMLMLGNILRESGVVERLSKTAQNELINLITIFLGTTLGATAKAETFLTLQTIGIILLGLVAFAGGTIGGLLQGNLMCWASGGKINPLIGSAGVSAVPMSARVVQVVVQEENPGNYLLMHAMGPNVAGTMGSAIVAGVLLSLFG